MSGIAGIFYLDGRQINPNLLERMLDKINHRGKDKSGIWYSGSIGLGNNLLYTTPESLYEKLPLEDKERNLTLVSDARIDNRDELISELKLIRKKDEQITDSEIILSSYIKWQENCTKKLLGDFVFVIWDDRNKKLFCARDHMGVRPFYYFYVQNRFFAFGSEIKAILSLPEVSRKLNEIRLAEYLISIFDDKEITFYTDVLRLPPAHTLTIGNGGLNKRCYWTLDPKGELHLSSDVEYEEKFREIFTRAVKRRLRSAFPVGSFLSGGLDSSSIVCTALKIFKEENTDKKLHTFSFIFDEVPECDERYYINKVLEHCNGFLEKHFIHGDKISPLTDIEKVFFHNDEPFYAPNLFLHWEAYKMASKNGVRILLDGIDGDTVVSHGYLRIAELLRAFQMKELYTEVSGLSKNTGYPAWKILLSYGVKPSIPGILKQAKQKLCHFNAFHTSALYSPLNKEFAKLVGMRGIQEQKGRWRWQKTLSSLKEEHDLRLSWGLIPFTLELMNKAYAAFSIDSRYPFFDKELVEYCLSLPSDQKLRGGWTRSILRRALKNILPCEIRWRKNKSNLGTNFKLGFLESDREFVKKIALQKPDIVNKYVDIPSLDKLYKDCYNPTTKGTDKVMALWNVVTLGLWLESKH